MGLRGRGRGSRRYALKADPTRQWRLLDLQAIDTRLDQIAHAKKTLPQIAQLKDLRTQEELLDTELVRVRTELSDVQREVAKAEADGRGDYSSLWAGQGAPLAHARHAADLTEMLGAAALAAQRNHA